MWEKNDLVNNLKPSLQTVVATMSFIVDVCYFSWILASMLFCFCHRKNFNVSFHFFSYHFKTIVVIFKIPPCFPFFVVKCNENEEIDINPHYKSHRTFLFTIVYFSYCSNLKLHFQLALAETITKTKEEKVERRQHCE